MNSPGIYNVGNGFMNLVSLDGSLVTNSLILMPIHLLSALLEPSLPSRVKREETLKTPWGGLADL